MKAGTNKLVVLAHLPNVMHILHNYLGGMGSQHGKAHLSACMQHFHLIVCNARGVRENTRNDFSNVMRAGRNDRIQACSPTVSFRFFAELRCWLITKTAFSSSRCDLSPVRLVGAVKRDPLGAMMVLLKRREEAEAS